VVENKNMSSALIWHLIRDNNSFVVKRERTNRSGAVQFSSEPGNLLNVNTYKYSGIANENVIALTSDLVAISKVLSIVLI
jgi:large subunit ribosomal protein L28e